MKKIILLLATLVFAASAHAQKTCSKADESNAQKAIDRISSWSTLNATWKTYRHCDTGPVGESFTEAILRLVIDWKNMNQLADAMGKDTDYNAFILTHLKSDEAKGDAQDVYSRAKGACPKGLDTFCKDVIVAVNPPKAPPPATPAALPPVATPQPGVPSPSTPSPATPDKK
ncbi:hypothetical protein DSM104443_03851 [Usitatibacter rugosus]|uniref:Uncharacterized protein n=1 Tax=Usitatibacter rugosus TaxID=2732067 RepID=A0A6M4H0T2_9PROT|nr:hypothetical protein [Usitatibacter rugosus]QJR12758.1 hypothetical protein DSM104443_03851 [Usitatibacter rugosus]